MKIEYDKMADAIYFKILNTQILESEEVSPVIIYDYDKDDNIVGVEVLSLNKRTPEETKGIAFPLSEEEKAKFREFLINAFT
ncbi:uncharacterized conserved small protein [Xenococcus sp. PCC 7305]|uniref:DUF2283 domain-containing protein n=1 Tax=Xenococcus sp. PCC 7305 TaxID=102125 RepID=UPI0002AC2A0F|nr:DUF2283 domain-containing protein [Xenococcus sp. PCC 7305]ELS00392.1 uncharacterized conserved small protein [Xenococcus sp. PCC 7305]